MIDHLHLRVADLAASKAFYAAALAPLGFELAYEGEAGIAFGENLFLSDDKEPSSGVHVAFEAGDRAAVDAFYEAALAAGGRDNGAPGERPRYHPGYYGAYVLDPDGNNVEAVFHDR